jgi:3-hydroxymyristoyl/3-hydroxydecanoyl-(acyl carrier protein) dehydratase
MTFETIATLSARLAQLMGNNSRRNSQLHAQFLNLREASMQQIRDLIELQMGSAPHLLAVAQPVLVNARPALFDSQQLDHFGAGNFSGCFGPAFARYDTRRIPRIPNGDLKMMTRVVAIEGNLRDLRQPASVEVEYDVPSDAWYLRDCGSVEMPYSLLMEMALQPCGFLSAYLDTYALVPHESFYFRNLDGNACVVNSLDVRGKTLTTCARLLTSVNSGGTVIQKFAFSVTCAGQDIYQGESTFGYFSTETMANQVGLDGGNPSQPWIRAQAGREGQTLNLTRWRSQASLHLPMNRFSFLDAVELLPNGGAFGKGYVYASRPINPRDWFYPFHFSGDPVMPGSLGVEAVLEGFKAYALAVNIGQEVRLAHFSLAAGAPAISWRYRGQITPQHKMMELEIHLHAVKQNAAGLLLSGDASVWVDNLRIYEVKNACVLIAGQA